MRDAPTIVAFDNLRMLVSAKARPTYVRLVEGHYVPLLEELELGKSLTNGWLRGYP